MAEDDDDSTVWTIILAARDLIVPPERVQDGRMLLQILLVLAVAVLPLALLPAGPWLFPQRAASAVAAAGTPAPPLADRIRAETGLTPGFVYDLSREPELAAARAAEAGAEAIAGDLAAQKAFRLRVYFLSGLAVLGVLAAAILFAQMRLVRQHWDIILESVRPPVDPLLRQGQFRRAFGGFLLGFGALVFGAAGLARHFAAAPATAALVEAGIGLLGLAVALAALRWPVGQFGAGWRAALLVLGLGAMADISLGGSLWGQLSALSGSLARSQPAAVAAILVALSGLAALALADRMADRRTLREQGLAPLAAVALVLGGLLAGEALDTLSLPGQGPLPGFLAAMALPAGPILTVAAGLAAMVVATTAVTLFGCLTIARNYPDADAVEAFAIRFRILGRTDPDPRKPKQIWTDMCRVIGTPPKGTPTEGAPVRLSLTPAQAEALIRALTLTLAVLMVVALVVLSLGFDLLEAGLTLANGRPAPAALRESFGLSLDATVLLLGLGFSAALSVAYVWPMLRIAPHAGAAAEPPTPTPGAAERLAKALAGGAVLDPATGTIRLADTEGLVEPDPSLAETAAAMAVAKMIGADKAKFRVICRAWIYGGAFHSILDETLAGKLRQILTLLAPALAGTLLGLVG